ncbi:polysaccharide biosynthesis/export family protein [Desulfocurvus vexinensis]|uniref:polysaccharide biosynthesis/export family protein n=1 Tax=Desulfocurvus vexinensis TaxID=399548 RepID=UPI000491ED8B|nr:polysaccharide biosynthesis/export family protein [Desulfocurvus vexinensis]
MSRRAPRRLPWLAAGLAALAWALLAAGCGGTLAAKGTPVAEVQSLHVERRALAERSQAEREELERMSAATQNSVFKTVDGLPEYRIGPLDVLEIASRFGEEVRVAEVVVNNRGLISYSFVDDLPVAGLTASETDELLTQRLGDYLRNPRIDVLVKEHRSRKASLLGEVASLRQTNSNVALPSGKITLTGRTTLVELISRASGYTQSADLRNVRLIRDGRSYDINVYDIIEQGKDWLNVVIDDGDVVDIPELPEGGRKVFVMGEVAYQGVYDVKKADTLLAALAVAGMPTRQGRKESTLVVRPDPAGGTPLVMSANVSRLLEQGDLSQNVTLREGDMVYVPREIIGDINEWIVNHTPLLDFIIEYPKGVQDVYFYRNYLKLDSKKQ